MTKQKLALDPQKLTNSELMRLCLTCEDETAWPEFFRRFQPLIASVVVTTLRRQINPGPAIVDDLVQETFLKLCVNNCKALRKFDLRHNDALAGFLKIMASGVVKDYLRSLFCKKRGSHRGEEDLGLAVTIPSQKHSWELMERAILFRQIYDCLLLKSSDPHFRRNYRIFYLYFVKGLSSQTISQIPEIGLSVKGVESALMAMVSGIKTSLRTRS